MLKFIPKIINKFEFRFVFYILSILLIWKFALIPFKQFNAFETIAPLQVFDQKKDATKFENFNFVEAGLDLQKFGFYDARKYHFEVNGLVWFKFDPKLVSVDEIGKFFFDKVVKETRGKPVVQATEDGKTIVLYYVELIFKNNLIFRDFPYDDHRVFINILNEDLLNKNILFVTKDSNFAIENWRSRLSDFALVDKGAESAYYTLKSVNHFLKKDLIYPEAVFYIDIKTEGLGGFFIILFPLLVMFFLSLLSLCIPVFIHTLSLTLQSLFTLLLYRYVLSYVAPEISEYVFSDICFVTVLSFLCGIILTNIVCFHYLDSDEIGSSLKEKIAFIRNLAFILFLTAFVVIFYMFLPK